MKYEFMLTKKALDPYLFALNMDTRKYCMIIVGGGDGTMHEVANGLIARTDGQRIPICPVPNGSGDDFCASIGINSVDDALDYLAKGLVVKLDTIRCLTD